MNDYISILLGAAVGCALPYIVNTLSYLLKRCSKTPICGKWTSNLCLTVEGAVKWAKADLEVKKEFYANIE